MFPVVLRREPAALAVRGNPVLRTRPVAHQEAPSGDAAPVAGDTPRSPGDAAPAAGDAATGHAAQAAGDGGTPSSSGAAADDGATTRLADLQEALAKVSTAGDLALAQQQRQFDQLMATRAELQREANVIRDMAMEQLKADEEVLKKWIAMI